METEVLALFIPIILILSTAVLVYFYLSNRNKERLALIEKSSSHEDLKLLYAKKDAYEPLAYKTAKWGIILISAGLAVIIGILLQPYAAEEITFGLVLLFPGIGLLVYYSQFKDSAKQLPDSEE